MVHRVEETEESGGRRDKAYAQAQAFREQLAARKAAQSPTAAANTDDDSISHEKTTRNRDRELHSSQTEGFDVKATNATATGVSEKIIRGPSNRVNQIPSANATP